MCAAPPSPWINVLAPAQLNVAGTCEFSCASKSALERLDWIRTCGMKPFPVQLAGIFGLSTTMSHLEPRLAARSVRELWAIGCHPIDSVSALLRDKGFRVTEFRSDGYALAARISVDQVGWPTLTVEAGARVSTCDYRMRLGHALGHVVLHASHPTEREADKMEDEADSFARDLLCPSGGVFSYGEAEVNLRELNRQSLVWGLPLSHLLYQVFDACQTPPRDQVKVLERLDAARRRGLYTGDARIGRRESVVSQSGR